MELQIRQWIRPERRLWALCVVAAIYLPNCAAFVLGAGHCDTCHESWVRLVGIIQAVVIQFFTRHYCDLPSTNWGWGYYTGSVLVQLVWVAGWCWLAVRGRVWFWAVLVVAGGMSTFCAWGVYWMIKA